MCRYGRPADDLIRCVGFLPDWGAEVLCRRGTGRLRVTTDQDEAGVRSLVYRMAECYGAKDVEGVLGMFVGETSSMVGTGLDELRR